MGAPTFSLGGPKLKCNNGTRAKSKAPNALYCREMVLRGMEYVGKRILMIHFLSPTQIDFSPVFMT